MTETFTPQLALLSSLEKIELLTKKWGDKVQCSNYHSSSPVETLTWLNTQENTEKCRHIILEPFYLKQVLRNNVMHVP